MLDNPSLQREIVDICRLLDDKSWVANHDGNVSARLPDNARFLATPTAFAKRNVQPSDLLIVDGPGKVLAGRRNLFSEWHLHATCYRAREDVRAVVHAHPPFATAYGLTRREGMKPLLPEMVVSLGRYIPLIGYHMPKSVKQEEELTFALTTGDADAALIAGNGVLTVGVTLEQALLRMELVEHCAKILAACSSFGSLPFTLSDADIQKLLEARTKAGLGRAGRAQKNTK